MPDRIIKESICTSDTLNDLSWFDQVFFHRLTVVCDDFGRFDARPKILKSRLFPLRDDVDYTTIEKTLNALYIAGLIQMYANDGKPYLYLPTWDRHQRVRAKRSKYPDPAACCGHLTADDGKCPRNPIQSDPNPIQSESSSDRADCGESPPAAAATDETEIQGLCRVYEKSFGRLPRMAVEDMREWLADGITAELIDKIVTEAAAAEPHSPVQYTRSIVSRCKAGGIKTVEQFEQSNKRDAVPGRGAGRAAQPDYTDTSRYEEVGW